MKDYQIIHHISESQLFCKATKMFTYPSKFLDSYTHRIAEINLPSITYKKPEMNIITYEGSTKSITKAIFGFRRLDKLSQQFTPALKIDNKYIYNARYCLHSNYSHLMVDLVSLLLEIKDKLPNLLVILPKKASPLAIKFLKQFGFEVLCTNQHIEGKIIEVIVNNDKELCPTSYYGNYQTINIENYNKNTPKKVFLVRKSGRKITNEAEIENYLKNYGFEKLYFEDIPFTEQFSVARNAEAMVALLGSGVTNLVFNTNQVKFIELAHPGYLVDYWRRIVNYVGGNWCRVTGEITDDILSNIEKKHNYYVRHEVKINLDSLDMAMKYIECQKDN